MDCLPRGHTWLKSPPWAGVGLKITSIDWDILSLLYTRLDPSQHIWYKARRHMSLFTLIQLSRILTGDIVVKIWYASDVKKWMINSPHSTGNVTNTFYYDVMCHVREGVGCHLIVQKYHEVRSVTSSPADLGIKLKRNPIKKRTHRIAGKWTETWTLAQYLSL